jgi:peptidoglycan/LPS O-acetylase OafA/YrhL
LAVTWFHLTNGYDTWVGSTGLYGWLGVSAFFVISGVVVPLAIASMVLEGGRYTPEIAVRFIAKRITRLEPPYLASVAMVITLSFLSASIPGFRGQDPVFDVVQIVSHAFYLTPFLGKDWLQPVYWTLLFEFVFYLCVALTYGVAIARGKTAQFVAASLFVIGLCFVGWLPDQSVLFLVGVATYGIAWVVLSRVACLCVGVAALGFLVLQGKPLEAAIGSVTMLWVILGRDFRFSEVAIGRVVIWLGSISYSLYLIHVPIGGRIVNLGLRFVDAPIAQLLLSLLALAVSLTVAWAFHHAFERPSLRWSRSIGQRSVVSISSRISH